MIEPDEESELSRACEKWHLSNYEAMVHLTWNFKLEHV